LFNVVYSQNNMLLASQALAGSRRQDCKVSGTWKDTHLFPSCHRDSGIKEPASYWTGAHHCHYRGVDSRETGFLFQRLSMALQMGNAVSFSGIFPQVLPVVAVANF